MQHDFVLLDRSGSMGGTMWDEALNAINSYVKKLADDKVDTGVTLACFDLDQGVLDYKVMRDRITPASWAPIGTLKEDADVRPRGSTPLNDAVGKMVAAAKAATYDKVAIIIMTDGHENASREYTVPQIKAMLDECRAKGWQVIFLGANFDNVSQATSYGTASGQTVNSSRRNLRATMDVLSTSRAAYATTGAAMALDEKTKKKLAEQ